MRSEKGITLLSLIIYIILVTIVLAMLGFMTNFFFSNTKYVVNNAKDVAEFNKFNMYFVEDVKNNKTIYEIKDEEITFADGTIYTYKGNKDNSIYRNKTKICTNVEYCTFSKQTKKVDNTIKQIVTVNIVIKSRGLFETTSEYVLKYW